MYLKSITLRGFKSFAQTKNLLLDPGITCVVGPNGSGKSNIVDAVAWVMGEQGPKSMRGGKMEDVIFAGTDTLSPLGRAEVRLSIDNSDGSLPVDYAEVSLSRVLSSSGASEYFINGQRCRLLDVQELLSDTGLGREMHSIVGQGQLDLVLKASPIDRRALIEEAAGVIKFRRRREKTVRKLESMQANLLRLEDLISEVKRNLRPLRGQAQTALQASEISASIRLAKSQLFSMQYLHLQNQLEIASNEEARQKSEASLTRTHLETLKRALADVAGELDLGPRDAAMARMFAVESLEAALRNVSASAHQRSNLIFESSNIIKVEKLEDLQGTRDQLRRARTELMLQIEAAENSFNEASRAKTDALGQLKEFDSEVELFRENANQRKIAEAKQEGQRRSLEEATALAQGDLESHSRELANLLEEIRDLESRRRKIHNVSESSLSKIRAKYEKSRRQNMALRASIDTARDEVHQLEKRRDFLSARYSTLCQVLDSPDGATNLMKAELRGLEGRLADQIKVQPGYEKAVSAALGSLANAVNASSWGAAVAAISHLRENDLGRGEIVVAGRATRKSGLGDLEAKSLLSVVEGPAVLQELLGRFVIANDIVDARELLEKSRYRDHVVVTKNGDYLARNLVKGGGVYEPSRVDLISERDSVSRDLDEVNKDIEKSNSSLNLLQNAQVALDEDLKLSLSELERQIADSASSAETFGRLDAQIEGAKAEVTRLESSIALLREKISASSDQLRSLGNNLEDEVERGLFVNLEARTELAEKLEVASRSETEAKIELVAMRERLGAAMREEEELEKRLQVARRENADWEQKLQIHEAESKRARKVLATCELIRPRVERMKFAARSELKDLEVSRQQTATRVTELRAQISATEALTVELNQGAQEAEMKSYELKLQQHSVKEKILDELGLTPEELLENGKDPGDSEASSEADLEKVVRNAESRLAKLGAFNPLALEEYAALEERHRYLTTQLADLNRARTDIKHTVREIDEKISSTFIAAFEDTKRAFEEIFPLLFPGGKGALSLGEPEDGQEGGVEISIRPAGKRIERLTLLSGGERSLAALAYLIAIFKARPSPFYILDEVEAALDDVNLGRLLEVLKNLQESCQLIIVTHQKKTMEIADALYGVSMGADGVTKVMSQTLEKAS